MAHLMPKTLPFFENVPWYTSEVAAEHIPLALQEKFGIKASEGLLDLIQRNEADMPEHVTSSDLYEKIINSSDVSMAISQCTHTPAALSRVANALLLYRVLDVSIWINKPHESIPSDLERRPLPVLSLPGWKEFCSDWRSFLAEGIQVLRTLSSSIPASHSPSLSQEALHLQIVYQCVGRVAKNKVLTNILLAAMHLHSLLKGQEYPDDLPTLAQQKQYDISSLENLCTRAGIPGLRLPLHLALTVSPCALFLPTEAHKQHVGRAILLALWQGLGGARPTPLLQIEHLLWQGIFDLAFSGGTRAKIITLCDTIDEILEKTSDSRDEEWFGNHNEPSEFHFSSQPDNHESDAMDVDDGHVGRPLMNPLTIAMQGYQTDATNDADASNNPNSEAEEPSKAMDVDEGIHATLKRPTTDASVGSVETLINLDNVTIIDDHIIEVIDLTEDMEDLAEPNLASYEVSTARTRGPMRVLYDALGNNVSYEPSFHCKKDLDYVMQLIDRVEQEFTPAGKPLHVVDPDNSLIHVMSSKEFYSTPVQQLQSLHAAHHLLVTGLPQDDFGFDEAGLLTLAPPDKTISIQDFSILVGDDQTQRCKYGTTADLLNSHMSPHGKILNALDFPLPFGLDPPTSVSSDIAAWSALASVRSRMPERPSSGMRWAIAATAGACSTFHVDADGLSTYIDVANQQGSKYWVLVGPKRTQDPSAFASVEKQFKFHNGTGVDTEALGDVQVEAVLLTPGTRLEVNSYMRPNTPHAVLTPTSTICYGGHYLSTSTIRSACYGHYITFCLSTLLTNTEHTSDCQRLFRRLMDFYHSNYIRGQSHATGPLKAKIAHIPDVSTFDGLHDLFTVCNLIEFSNIVNPQTYSDHGLDPAERYDMVHARKKSREIVTWVLGNYELDGNTSVEQFYWRYLAYQARAICRGKDFAECRGAYSYDGEPFCDKVRSLMKHSFIGISEFWPMWHEYNGAEPLGFAWPLAMVYRVRPRASRKDVNLSWNPNGMNYDDFLRMDMKVDGKEKGKQKRRKLHVD